jgi:hypothetical protein
LECKLESSITPLILGDKPPPQHALGFAHPG